MISGEIDYEVVGSGSIITNAGTFNNALMVRTNETSTSTIEIAGMQFQTTTISESFDFLVEGFPMAIASMESWTSTGQDGADSDQEGYTLLSADNQLTLHPNQGARYLPQSSPRFLEYLHGCNQWCCSSFHCRFNGKNCFEQRAARPTKPSCFGWPELRSLCCFSGDGRDCFAGAFGGGVNGALKKSFW